LGISSLPWALVVERVTGIESALLAWEITFSDRRSPAVLLTWAYAAYFPFTTVHACDRPL
jgi:hypothetical protein